MVKPCLIAIAVAALLSSCATAPRIAPRFTAPTTATLGNGIKHAKTNVQKAKDQAKDIEKVVEKECPQLRMQIRDLQITLDNALSDLNTSEGARQQLDAQLQQQTKQANNLADSYDKSAAQIVSLKVSRHRWVKLFLGSTLLLTGALVWIFRKPLLMLATGL